MERWKGMLTGWQWIFILAIAVFGAIFIPNDNTNFHNYDCYDKSAYKCGKCKKKCKWNAIVRRHEELEDFN